ncbi:MAG: ABC transporter substrate-binding protein [Deltaproteobacteria bacterium]|nr:ABC transporter substrate-binding protein [Deltaproteobacteria bacterium]MBM4297654.1 ABC transporter substrate-binding protein [Deltaproteobacteria bacterium]
MARTIFAMMASWFVTLAVANAQPVRGAFPSPSIQILPMMVAAERGFYKKEGLDLELIFVRGAATAVQALIANQIHFIFSIGPQMPAVWEGNDIMILAQQVGRPTFSMVVTTDIQKISDLKGKKIGVTFGGSTAAGTKALLELNKINPDREVEYINLPGNEPKITAMKQGIISAALLAPPADYLATKAGLKRLVSLADIFKDTAFTGLAATSRTIKENPQMVRRMVRAIVRSVIHTRDNPEDALQITMKRLKLERDAAQDAYQMIRDALVPVPTEKGVELMAQWQAIALNTKPKRKVTEYMDLRLANEVMTELGQK